MKKELCPLCGSSNTIKIIWGVSCHSEELNKELGNGEFIIGGLSIPKDIPTPSYHCYDCEKDIILDFEKELEHTISLEFSIGGFFEGHTTTTIYREENKFYIKISHFYTEKKIEITKTDYFGILNRIYLARVLEWKERYFDPYILDGEQWHLKINFSKKSLFNNKTIFETGGSNDYPPSEYWNMLLAAIKIAESICKSKTDY